MSEPERTYLSKSGRELWDYLAEKLEMDLPTSVLVKQACRIVDHLDRLDIILRKRETWIRLANDGIPNDDGNINIVMDGALTEFRQQAMALNTIFNKLGVGKIEAGQLTAKPKTESKSDELARKRAQKLQAAKDSQQ